MTGQMIEFDTVGAPATGYLATPEGASGPGVMVLHAWWGLTEPFRQAADKLAEAGFVALAPDLYHGQTATTVEQAEALGGALDQKEERWRGDIAGAMRYLRQHAATGQADGKVALVGFSLGGAYALDMTAHQPEGIGAVAVFYTVYPGLDYRNSQATYLCHFAEHDAFDPPENVAAMEQDFQKVGKQATFYTYPETEHWFFEQNRPDVYNAEAAALAWERTVAFLNAHLR